MQLHIKEDGVGKTDTPGNDDSTVREKKSHCSRIAFGSNADRPKGTGSKPNASWA
jgi:hypothetical protein